WVLSFHTCSLSTV
ncbi:hypothetical protein D046_1843B, partial [Vibrio parahaemolyticus V-223/04]